MDKPTVLTMQPGEWRYRLAELCRDCALADAGEQADMLRMARSLFAIAPEDASPADAWPVPGLDEFERLLMVGAWESAAFDLMPPEATCLVSRSGEDSCMASVMLPGLAEEVSSDGDTVAMALTSALAAAISMLNAEDGRVVGLYHEERLSPGVRRAPSALH
ncbi:MAG TPA: hypothetical protein VFF98_02750 [Novosphingobium sp.]|nr:hypothetical protein [Novosphingobium sp.]